MFFLVVSIFSGFIHPQAPTNHLFTQATASHISVLLGHIMFLTSLFHQITHGIAHNHNHMATACHKSVCFCGFSICDDRFAASLN
jgi:hypothetical protein